MANKELNELIASVTKKFGANSIMTADKAKFIQLVREPTGIASLDFAIGGGYPYGRFTHIYGNESAGKTFTAMTAAAEVQRNHPNDLVVWCDLERVFDADRARQIGMDLSRTILISEPSIEATVRIAEEFIENDSVRLYVFDSIAAIITVAEIDNDIEDQTMGTGARVVNRFLRRWLAKNTSTENKIPRSFALLLNQTRMKIQRGGNPNIPVKPKPTGGRGLRFFASIELEISKGERIELNTVDGDATKTFIGYETKALVEKNNTFPPRRVGKFFLCTRSFEVGGYSLGANSVDNARDIVRFATKYGVLKRGGAWYSYGEDKWNGKIAMQTHLQKNPEFMHKLYSEVMNAIRKELGVFQAPDKTQDKAKPKAGIKLSKKATGKNTTRKRKSVA